MTRTCTALLLALPLLAAGCVGHYTGHPDSRGPVDINSRTRPDLADTVEWRRVMRGAGKTSLLLGYVRTDAKASAESSPTYWIYDAAFNLKGRVSPRGRVTQFMRDGSAKWVGNYSLDLACLQVFGYETKRTIRFEHMPDPRG